MSRAVASSTRTLCTSRSSLTASRARVSSGTAVTDYEFQGMRVPGEVVDITEVQSSEQPARNFYRRWAEFMDAPDWDALASWRKNTRAAAE